MTHSGNLLKESKRCRWRHRRRRRCRCCRRRLGVNLLIIFFLHFLPWEFPGEEFWNILPRTIIGQRAIFDAKKMQDRLFYNSLSLSLSFFPLSLGPIPGISHYLGYIHLCLPHSMCSFYPFLSDFFWQQGHKNEWRGWWRQRKLPNSSQESFWILDETTADEGTDSILPVRGL